MKQKISITLSREVRDGIDRIAGSKQSRSAVSEAVLAEYLRERAQTRLSALGGSMPGLKSIPRRRAERT